MFPSCYFPSTPAPNHLSWNLIFALRTNHSKEHCASKLFFLNAHCSFSLFEILYPPFLQNQLQWVISPMKPTLLPKVNIHGVEPASQCTFCPLYIITRLVLEINVQVFLLCQIFNFSTWCLYDLWQSLDQDHNSIIFFFLLSQGIISV